MENIEVIRYNEDFARDMDAELLAKWIIFEGAIPDGINNILYYNNPTFNKERDYFVNYHPKIMNLMYAARAKEDSFFPDWDKMNAYKNSVIFKFVEDYPELKPLISHIEVWDQDLNIIDEIPFEEYLKKQD